MNGCETNNKCDVVPLRGTWGAGQDTQLMIYRAMIRSRLDYGCLCYGTAARSALKTLDVIQAKSLRIDCGVSTGNLAIKTGNAVHTVIKLRRHQGEQSAKLVLENA